MEESQYLDFLEVLDQLLPECYFQTKEIRLPTDQTLSQIIYRNQTGFGLLFQLQAPDLAPPISQIFHDLQVEKVPFGLVVSLAAVPDLPELQVVSSPPSIGGSTLLVILNGLDPSQCFSKLRLVINTMLAYQLENEGQLN